MQPEARMFRPGFSAGLFLRSALALALLAQISPAHAETIDLACTSTWEGPPQNVRRLIDTDRRIVTTYGVDGKLYEDPITMISDQYIRFTDQVEKGDVVGVNGTVDRIAGTMTFDTVWKGSVRGSKVFACRRAAKKF